MRKLKKWITAALSTVMLLAMPLTSQAFTYYIGPIKYADMTNEQYDAIYNTLKSMAEDGSQGNNKFRSTGVVCNTFEEAKAIMDTFSYVFPSTNAFGLVWNEWGSNRIILDNYDLSEGTFDFTYYSNTGRKNEIWAIWAPGVDARAIISESEQAMTEIERIAETAPKNTREKLRYYYDTIKERSTYDNAGIENGYYSLSSYDALIKGKSVCGGFAKTFMLLCKKAGIPCGIVREKYSGEGRNHAYNIVYLDNRWLKVDATSAIAYGNGNDHFLEEMSSNIQEYCNQPYVYGIQQ